MKYYELDAEEQEILDAVENGEYKVVNDPQQRADMIAAAKNSLNKTRNINIRVSERLLYKLKTKAAEEGLPYQTLAASILHQHTK